MGHIDALSRCHGFAKTENTEDDMAGRSAEVPKTNKVAKNNGLSIKLKRNIPIELLSIWFTPEQLLSPNLMI